MASIIHDGNVIVVCDEDEEMESANVVPISRVASNAKGRARLYHGVCPLHGMDDDNSPCSKFAHLPGNGKGIKQPHAGQMVVNTIRAIVKPLFLFALVIGAGYFIAHKVPTITTSLVPKFETRPIANPNPDANGNNKTITNSGTKPGQISNKSGSGIGANCFVAGNPCGLIVKAPVKK